MTRGEESGTARHVASAENAGGSWTKDDAASRTKGNTAFGPCSDPMMDEASNMVFSNIVTLPVLPEPTGPLHAAWQSLKVVWDQSKNMALGAVRATVENENADAGRWYHYNERKVPGLWECDTTDTACMYEAEMAYIRNREVDRQILGVLEERLRMCWASQEAQWHTIDTNLDVCGEISMFKRQAEMNYATKYKSLPAYGMQSSKALMKQKNRFIEKRWLERQGRSYSELQNMLSEPLSAAFYWDCQKWE